MRIVSLTDYHKTTPEESNERLSPPAQNTCWNCGRKANETCSGCNLARYCGSFCQHKDWEQHHQVSIIHLILIDSIIDTFNSIYLKRFAEHRLESMQMVTNIQHPEVNR